MNKTIDELVNKFLGWKLPKDFAPDGGIVFDKHQNHHFTPIGTNLFTADQAKQMFEYLLEGEPLTLDKIYTNNERHKGLVKRLLIQLEIDIELDKATQLCNAFHAEISQGEAENKVIVDYDEKLKSFYINDHFIFCLTLR